MFERKYGFTNETIIRLTVDNRSVKMHRIVALRDFGHVRKGDIGGYIEKEENLSHEGLCWVYDNGMVYDNAVVSGNATVHDYASVHENAKVHGDASICNKSHIKGFAKVFGEAMTGDNAIVSGNAMVHGKAFISNKARIYGEARVCGNAKILGHSNVRDVAVVKGNVDIRGLCVIHGDVELGGYCTYCNEDIDSNSQSREQTFELTDLFYKEIIGYDPLTDMTITKPRYKVSISDKNVDDVVIEFYLNDKHEIMVHSNIFDGTHERFINFIPHYLLMTYGINIWMRDNVHYMIPYEIAVTNAEKHFKRFI